MFTMNASCCISYGINVPLPMVLPIAAMEGARGLTTMM
jgi:hypothetical protein